jgi:hypothetical protein
MNVFSFRFILTQRRFGYHNSLTSCRVDRWGRKRAIKIRIPRLLRQRFELFLAEAEELGERRIKFLMITFVAC